MLKHDKRSPYLNDIYGDILPQLENILKCIPFILTALLPIVWYFALRQHSVIHAFFTYRILIITLISLMILPDILFEREKEKT